MIFKKIISLLFLISCKYNLHAQTHVVLDWNSVNSYGKEIVSFDQAIYLKEYEGLPSYQQLNKLKDNYFYDIELYDIEYSEISDLERTKLELLEIPSNINLTSEVILSIFLNFPFDSRFA